MAVGRLTKIKVRNKILKESIAFEEIHMLYSFIKRSENVEVILIKRRLTKVSKRRTIELLE